MDWEFAKMLFETYGIEPPVEGELYWQPRMMELLHKMHDKNIEAHKRMYDAELKLKGVEACLSQS